MRSRRDMGRATGVIFGFLECPKPTLATVTLGSMTDVSDESPHCRIYTFIS
jgi:hypothetical protein